MTGAEPPAAPLRIFISYRRDETSGHAGRLYDALVDRFGVEQVFMDVDAIDPGADFVRVIDRAVAACDILIALIGRRWVTASDEAGRRRLDDPADFVRIELESALGREVSVIPACVQGASIPSPEELPENLAPLARRQAVQLRDDAWHDDVRRLIRRLERLAAEKATAAAEAPPAAAPQVPPPARRLPRRRLLALGAALAGIAGIAVALALTLGGGDGGGGTAGGSSRSESELRALIPPVTRTSCQSIDYGEKSAQVSLECSGERVAVQYNLFGSTDVLKQWYSLRRERERLLPGDGGCEAGSFRGEGRYPGGRRLCYVDSHEPVIVWTDEQAKVGAEANVYEGTGPAAAASLLRQWLCCLHRAP